MANKARDGIYPYTLADGKTRWMVSFRDNRRKQVLKRGFERKIDAQRYKRKRLNEIDAGEYIAPRKLRTKVGDVAAAWLEHKEISCKPSTFQTYRSRWNIHVGPRWAETAVGDITVRDVQAWINGLAGGDRPSSASLISDCHGVLVGVLDTAVNNGALKVNPIKKKIELPKRAPAPRRYLSVTEVQSLAESSAHPEIIYTLVYTGLRWGELTALRVRNVDFNRRRITVESTVTQLRDKGRFSENAPKSWEHRKVPFPPNLDEILRDQCARKHGDDFLFMSPNGGHLKPPSSQTGWFETALRRAGLPHMRVHDLRHTTASLSVQAGANVMVLQRLLGHKSAAHVLDIYSDLYDEDLDMVAGALGKALDT
ncbi:tyrosine-type recombinase/integrase [Rothia koreensis]|uniref:tyrosine-type recombinase/integrase n=1 Tax=Rothia koreensis TaxID=592378 RepID=UPI003F255219